MAGRCGASLGGPRALGVCVQVHVGRRDPADGGGEAAGDMCGGTVKTACRPGGRRDAARHARDAACRPGRTPKTLAGAKVRQRGRAGRDAGLTELGTRLDASFLFQNLSEIGVPSTGRRAVSFCKLFFESTCTCGTGDRWVCRNKSFSVCREGVVMGVCLWLL